MPCRDLQDLSLSRSKKPRTEIVGEAVGTVALPRPRRARATDNDERCEEGSQEDGKEKNCFGISEGLRSQQEQTGMNDRTARPTTKL